jgi:hypothetical protein
MLATPSGGSLDDQISAVFSLLGLLLVFVIAYFSALWPRVEDLIAVPRPEANADRQILARRLRSHRNLFLALIVIASLVIGLLVPVSRRVVDDWTIGEGFPTIRAGLLLVDVFLGGVVLASGVMSFRLGRRARQVQP